MDSKRNTGAYASWFFVVLVVWLLGLFGIARFLSTHVENIDSNDIGIRSIAFLISILTVALLVGLAGRGQSARSRWLGALIDDNNRVSLSRFQACLWTVLIFPALAVAAAWNYGYSDKSSVADSLSISIPTQIWLALGISATTLVAAGVIKNTKTNQGQAADDLALSKGQALTETADPSWDYSGNVACHASWTQANLGDLYLADTGNPGTPPPSDFNKVQQLILSMVVVIAYGAILFRIWSGVDKVDTFPKLSDGAVMILLISHA